ncbi:MAG: helix-turn-helix transcriptional regulator [Burkholderiaceae bacterium]
MSTKLLTADEVAKRLRISLRTLETIVAAGDGPPFCRIGRSRRWDQDQLDSWIRDKVDMENLNEGGTQKDKGKN